MPTLTEGGYANGFVISEAPGTYSRENKTLISGQTLLAGRVLGKITASGKYTALAPAAGNGSEVAAAILVADTDASGGDKTCAAAESRQLRPLDVDLHEINVMLNFQRVQRCNFDLIAVDGVC